MMIDLLPFNITSIVAVVPARNQRSRGVVLRISAAMATELWRGNIAQPDHHLPSALHETRR